MNEYLKKKNLEDPELLKILSEVSTKKQKLINVNNKYLKEFMSIMNQDNFNKIKSEFEKYNNNFLLEDFIAVMLEIFSFYKNKISFIKNLIKLFKEIDLNGDGILEFNEFLQYILEYQNKLCIDNSQKKNKIKNNQIQKLIEIYDTNCIDFDKMIITRHVLKDKNFHNYQFLVKNQKNETFLILKKKTSHFFFLFDENLRLILSIDFLKILKNKKNLYDNENELKIFSYDIIKNQRSIILLTNKEIVVYEFYHKYVLKRFMIEEKKFLHIFHFTQNFIILFDIKNFFYIYDFQSTCLFEKEKIDMSCSEMKQLYIFSSEELFVLLKNGYFYHLKKDPHSDEMKTLEIYHPYGEKLTKGACLIKNRMVIVFWGYSNFFKIFYCNNLNGEAENIFLHNTEIENCCYMENQDRLISIDITNNIIIWDPSTYEKKQVLIPKINIKNLLFFQNKNIGLLLTSEGAYCIEIEGYNRYKENLKIVSFKFNMKMRKFILVTNKDVRLIGAFNGDLDYFVSNNRDETLPNSDLLKLVPIQTEDDMEKNNNQQNTTSHKKLSCEKEIERIVMVDKKNEISLYSLKDLQKVKILMTKNAEKKTNNVSDEKKDWVTVIKYIKQWKSLAVGFNSSIIKIFKFHFKNSNMWMRKLINGHDDSPISIMSCLDKYLLSASFNGRIAVWDLKKEKGIQCFHKFSDRITKLHYIHLNLFISFDVKSRFVVWQSNNAFNFSIKIVFYLESITMPDLITCSLIHEKNLFVGTKQGFLHKKNLSFNRLFSENENFEDSKNSQKNNQTYDFKLKDIVSCDPDVQEEVKENFPTELIKKSDNVFKLWNKSINNLRYEKSFKILIVFTNSEIKMLNEKEEICCQINIKEHSNFKWDLKFDWLKWDIKDISFAIDIMSNVEDRNILRKERIEIIKQYFIHEIINKDEEEKNRNFEIKQRLFKKAILYKNITEVNSIFKKHTIDFQQCYNIKYEEFELDKKVDPQKEQKQLMIFKTVSEMKKCFSERNHKKVMNLGKLIKDDKNLRDFVRKCDAKKNSNKLDQKNIINSYSSKKRYSILPFIKKKETKIEENIKNENNLLQSIDLEFKKNENEKNLTIDNQSNKESKTTRIKKEESQIYDNNKNKEKNMKLKLFRTFDKIYDQKNGKNIELIDKNKSIFELNNQKVLSKEKNKNENKKHSLLTNKLQKNIKNIVISSSSKKVINNNIFFKDTVRTEKDYEKLKKKGNSNLIKFSNFASIFKSMNKFSCKTLNSKKSLDKSLKENIQTNININPKSIQTTAFPKMQKYLLYSEESGRKSVCFRNDALMTPSNLNNKELLKKISKTENDLKSKLRKASFLAKNCQFFLASMDYKQKKNLDIVGDTLADYLRLDNQLKYRNILDTNIKFLNEYKTFDKLENINFHNYLDPKFIPKVNSHTYKTFKTNNINSAQKNKENSSDTFSKINQKLSKKKIELKSLKNYTQCVFIKK